MSVLRVPLVLVLILTWTDDTQCHICEDDGVRTLSKPEPIIAGDIIYVANFTKISIIQGESFIQVENGTFTATQNLSLDADAILCEKRIKDFKIRCDVSVGEVEYGVNLQVQPSNDFNPEFPNKTFIKQIREAMPNGSAVMDVGKENKAEDKDCGERVHYLGTDTPALGLVNGNNIVTTKVFDYEAGDREFNITVTAQDSGDPVRSSTFVLTVQVMDVDDENPAFRNDSYTLHVQEGGPVLPAEWVQATPPIYAFDQDLGINATIVYSIPAQSFSTPNPNISINGSDGRLMVAGELDRETVDTYRIVIEAHQADNVLRAATSTLTLIVEDINDNRPMFDPVNYNVTIQEHTADSVNIIRVQATDADIGNNSVFTYALTSETELSTINKDTGYIRVRNSTALDRETKNTYTITVNATEQESQVGGSCTVSCTATVTVTLSDINDNAPEFENVPYVFAAHNASIGEVIGQVTASDKDIGENGRIEYSIPDNTVFSVNSTTGIITLQEAAMSGQIFLISACDFGLNRLCDTELVTVKFPLHSVMSSNVTVNVTENVAIDTTVYVLKPEYEGYVLKMQTDSGPFLLLEDPDRIVTSGEIDREMTSEYIVPINVILQNQTAAVLTIKVNVLDENDNAPVFIKSPYKFNVADDAKQGDDVGIVTAYDTDEGVNGEVTYSIQGQQSSQDFDVHQTSGQITLKSIPDLAREFTEVVIVARDNGTPSRKNTTAVKVYVGQVPGKVRFFAPADKQEVENDKAELMSGMSDVLKVTVAFDEIRSVTSPYGPSCAIYLTATHTTRRAATTTGDVDEEDLRGRVEENYEELLKLFVKYQRSTSPNTDDPFTLPVIVLIAVAAALLLASILVTALLCRRSNRYKRQARLARLLNRDSTLYDTQEVKIDVEEESVHSLTGSLASQQLLSNHLSNGTAVGVLNSAYDNSGETHDTETQYTHVEDEDETRVKEEVIVDVNGENNPEQETGEVTPNPDYIDTTVAPDYITATIEPSYINAAVEPDYVNAEVFEDNVQTRETSKITDTVEPDYNDTNAPNPQTMLSEDNVGDIYAVVNKTKSEELSPPLPPPPPPPPVEPEDVEVVAESGGGEEDDEEDLPPPPPTPPRVRKRDTAEEEEEMESSQEDEPEPDYAKKVRFSHVKVTVIPDKKEVVDSEAGKVEGSETEDEEDTKQDRPFETIESPADSLSDDGTFIMTAL